jgi:sugar (pentulose or hexulose) kinase
MRPASHAPRPAAGALDAPRRRASRPAAPRRGRPCASAGAFDCTLGIDFGTSGARAAIVDAGGTVLADARVGYGDDDASARRGAAWEAALWSLLAALPRAPRARVAALAVDGTSATALLVDAGSGALLAPPRLYNEAQPAPAAARAAAIAPRDHTATAPTSTLCKLLDWDADGAWQRAAAEGRTPVLLDQASWLAALLHGDYSTSDWSNCLKAGFDPEAEAWPAWLEAQPCAALLPRAVRPPGARVAALAPAAAARAGLDSRCVVAAGTTDSIAAFFAAGVVSPGEAVTSLGSTLAVKLISERRVDDARFGVYSHRVRLAGGGDAWLVGGASNAGGAVLRQHFSNAQLAALTPRLNVDAPTGLDYVVLPARGERFPVNDPALEPRLAPRPADDAVFLQGMLESMARLEARAYGALGELGAAPALARVLTAGGGARNAAWTELRRRALGVPVEAAEEGEACVGAALLARQALGAPAARA